MSSSINFHRGRYGVSCGRQDKIEFRPTYTRCMRECLIGSWRMMSLFVARCQAAQDSIRGYMRDIEYPRERRTHDLAAGRGERLRLRTFLAFLPSAASSFFILGAPAGLRSSFVRPRSRSSRFLFLSLSRRTYSLHPGRCTRGVAYLYGATVLGAWHDFTIQKNAQQSNSGYHRATFNANIT